MRGLSYLVTAENSVAYRHNKSQNLRQKCGTWAGQLRKMGVRKISNKFEVLVVLVTRGAQVTPRLKFTQNK
jgi:hypothetical protein